MNAPEFVECQAFIQIEPRSRLSSGRPHTVSATRLTQKRPAWPQHGAVVVAVTIRVPVKAFMPLRPSAVVEIPADFADTVPVEVEAIDATRHDDTEDVSLQTGHDGLATEAGESDD